MSWYTCGICGGDMDLQDCRCGGGRENVGCVMCNGQGAVVICGGECADRRTQVSETIDRLREVVREELDKRESEHIERATLSFPLPYERDSLEIALKGSAMYSAIWTVTEQWRRMMRKPEEYALRFPNATTEEISARAEWAFQTLRGELQDEQAWEIFER